MWGGGLGLGATGQWDLSLRSAECSIGMALGSSCPVVTRCAAFKMGVCLHIDTCDRKQNKNGQLAGVQFMARQDMP